MQNINSEEEITQDCIVMPIWKDASYFDSPFQRPLETKWVCRFRNKKDERRDCERKKSRGFLVYQMDVKSAFLYGTIEEDVDVTQPLGFKDPEHPDKVYKVYVDDIIFGSTNKELCTGFEKLMKDKFQMSSMGELTFFLGLQVQQKEDGIFISQDKYVAEILKKFNYSDVKSASTPVDLEKPLVKDGDADDVDVHLYRSMIGSLMYLTASRPDIMFAVCACARFQVTPKTSHLLAVKRIFRYLKGKPTLGLWYSRDSPFELVAYTDSDYAGATQDRKSTTGGCQFLGNRLISWQCKKQTVVATSTTEAEYVAAASCCGQVLWIQNQLLDYGYNFMNTVINIDNNNLLTKGFDAGRFQYLVSSISKEVGIPRYLSLVVPLKKVGDEADHKELGDRMERAATTGIGSGSGPRCQDTILGDVDAQTSPKFAETHNVVAFLEKPIESDGFAEIINFLKASSVHYALTVNPIIYTSCIEQFWATAKVQTVNGVRQLQALVDKKRVIVTESSIRRDLYLDDAEGTDCLPTATIFEELARMGAKSTAWNEFSSSMASLIICLATNQKFNLSKYIFDAMVKHLDRGVKFLMYPRFLQVFINQQLGNMSTHKKIFVNPFHTKKVFANMKRAGKDFSRRITPLFDTMMVQASEEKKQPSKKAQRQEAEVPQDETELEESVPTPSNDSQPSEKVKDAQAKEIAALKKRIQRLERKKMSRPIGLKRLKKVGMSRRVESSEDQESLGALEDASKQGRSIADLDKEDDVTLVDEAQERQNDELVTAGEAVTTASIEGSAASTTIEEITLAQTLLQIKAAKPKVVTTAASTTTTTRPKARGVSSIGAKKDQTALDEQIARYIQAKLDVELIEEQKEGKNFSRRVTPLFATMMVQATQDKGVHSGIPTDSHQTPITTQPSSFRPQRKQSRRKQRNETEVPQDETHHDNSVPIPSNDLLLSGEDKVQLTELMILEKQVLDLEKAKCDNRDLSRLV
ncbi:putative ribonuclease H-like domain-containing protein [Tanacetum coccineum]|uniref:Ribonuclease H-like domain-containing protein n=1 Tax=Tanacetum coccineum TaxID=301880 RepID=A0ABQ5GNH4_9ASTR